MNLKRLIEQLIDMRAEFGGSLPVRINVRRTKTKSVAVKVNSVGFRRLPEVSSEPDGTIIITCSMLESIGQSKEQPQ